MTNVNFETIDFMGALEEMHDARQTLVRAEFKLREMHATLEPLTPAKKEMTQLLLTTIARREWADEVCGKIMEIMTYNDPFSVMYQELTDEG